MTLFLLVKTAVFPGHEHASAVLLELMEAAWVFFIFGAESDTLWKIAAFPSSKMVPFNSYVELPQGRYGSII